MSLPKITRFGADPLIDEELANKRYVDSQAHFGLHSCVIKRTAFQTISTATFTSVNWNTEDYDTDDYHSTSTNTDRITIPVGLAGKYLIQSTLRWDILVGGNAIIGRFTLNGSEIARFKGVIVGASAAALVAMIELAEGDIIRAQVWQDTGGNASFSNVGSFLGVWKMD